MQQILGNKVPRYWPKPLRRLRPETSFGFDVINFARDTLNFPLDPWQEWLVVHACELLPDGRPRFRQVLVLVARQNGKTSLLMVMALYWLFRQEVPIVLGTSTNLDYAKESWQNAVMLAESVEEFAGKIKVRWANGEQTLLVNGRNRYKIAASNRTGGRSLAVDRLIMDELREHHTWEAYNAVVPTMTAREHGQLWMITNQGDDRSVVLKSLREQAALGVDDRLGRFEWSGPDGAKATDIRALRAANPNLGYPNRISIDSLMGEAKRAEMAGGEQLAGFLTEHQCRWVPMLNPAIDPDAWAACYQYGALIGGQVTLCLDVSEDQMHATLYAAATAKDGITRIDAVAAWEGMNCTLRLRRELPFHVDRIKPKALGWFPNGPAAALTADLLKRRDWPPRGMTVEPLRNDVNAVCMGFAEQVITRQIVHSGDPLLDAHVAAAEKGIMGADGAWRFTRRGVGHVDAVYAAAGATHLARTLPAAAKLFIR